MSQKGRFCCKSRFALVTENSAGRGRGFRVKMRGTSSPRDKLTGDFGNAIEVIRICDYFPFGLFAKNLWPCNFRVLQQNRPIADSCTAANGVREYAPPHLITSSARNKRESGIVRPIAAAVLRLTTSSNLVGNWTGSSLIFAPRRVRST